jgi:hypothetical protein
MTPIESQMYDLGRQARRAGFPIESCNLSLYDVKRCWWVAGYIDEDIETKARDGEQ